MTTDAEVLGRILGGFDGVDAPSPRAAVEAELVRVWALDLPPHLEVARSTRVALLGEYLETATPEGGFRPPPIPA